MYSASSFMNISFYFWFHDLILHPLNLSWMPCLLTIMYINLQNLKAIQCVMHVGNCVDFGKFCCCGYERHLHLS